MAGLGTNATLGELRERIAGLENRPALAEAKGFAAQTPAGLLSAPAGLLHEVFTPERRNAGAALGFAFGMAQGLLGARRPALIYLQLNHEAQDVGLPYGPGLSFFGVDPESVVMGRLETMTELLWALEEAVSCRSVAAVIADVGGHPRELDFTASRRLSLRATAGGTSIFLMRYGRDREASAAQLRWRLVPEVSGETMFDARAPAGPRFRVALEKGRIGPARRAAGAGLDFLVDWTGNGFVVAGDSGKQAGSGTAGAAPHGAEPAALGDRLSQTG